MTSTHSGTRWGVVLIMLGAIAWSTAGLFPRLVHTDMFTTLFWRSALGGVTVLGFHVLLMRGQSEKQLFFLRPEEWVMSSLCACAMITFIAAFFYAPVADVVFIYGAFPTVTLVLSGVLMGQRIHRADVLCAVVVALGVSVILRGQTSLQSVFGTLLSFCATLLFALMTVGIKRFPQAQMVKVTYVGAFLSAIAMAPFATFLDISISDIGWLWLYGFMNIGVGFGLYLLGVRRVKAVLASLLCMIEIPLAPLWAYLVFGDRVPPQSLAGGAIILTAVTANLAWSARYPSPAAPAASTNP
jgi:drug/metabolite transporter (DMT)-like permease